MSRAKPGQAGQVGPAQGVVGHQPGGQGEHHHQLVHAGLGGVAQHVGVQGDDQGRGPRRPPTAEAPGRGPGQRDQGQAEESRQEADGHVPVTDHVLPDVQQHVVEGWVPVALEGVGDVAQREGGDVGAERLVQPQRRGLHDPQGQPQDGHHGQADQVERPPPAGAERRDLHHRPGLPPVPVPGGCRCRTSGLVVGHGRTVGEPDAAAAHRLRVTVVTSTTAPGRCRRWPGSGRCPRAARPRGRARPDGGPGAGAPGGTS